MLPDSPTSPGYLRANPTGSRSDVEYSIVSDFLIEEKGVQYNYFFEIFHFTVYFYTLQLLVPHSGQKGSEYALSDVGKDSLLYFGIFANDAGNFVIALLVTERRHEFSASPDTETLENSGVFNWSIIHSTAHLSSFRVSQ